VIFIAFGRRLAVGWLPDMRRALDVFNGSGEASVSDVRIFDNLAAEGINIIASHNSVVQDNVAVCWMLSPLDVAHPLRN
jgi:hypothetical protein